MATTRRDNPNYSDVLETLQSQHQEILNIFETFKAASGNSRVVPFANLKARLRQHSEAEEEVFYPVVSALGDDEAALITTASSEHDTLETALASVETAGAENASGGQVTTLETALKSHIRSERAGIFAAARKGLTHNQRWELALRVGDFWVSSIQT
jgi:hypothetical protein